MILTTLAAIIALGKQGGQFPGSPLANQQSFPIAVWLQDPSNAEKYNAAGFNLYVGLWEGPTEAQLSQLKAAGMHVICEQNAVGLAHRNDKTIVAWMHDDEPDNAQSVKDPVTEKETYGPCIPPEKIVDEYRSMRAKDPTRPVMLNLGQGVANDEWIGRGNGSSLKDYETYVKGGDIVSFDVYPVAGLPKPDPENYLWYVPKGLDRLAGWMGNTGVRWNCIECTRISGGRKATPAQVRSEVWMSLIHGSRGLIYFVHQFSPKFDEHALLDDPEMLQAVTNLNAQIQALAGVLNSPSLQNWASVESDHSDIPIDVMVKKAAKNLYVFAVGMRNGAAKGTLSVKGLPHRVTAYVESEKRSVEIIDGKFTDSFDPYGVHIYRIAERANLE